MQTHETHGRWRFALVSAAVLAVLGLWLVLPTGSQEGLLTRASYDASFLLDSGARGATGASPVVLVYLDLDSHLRERHSPSEPWPRGLHAQLVERLTAAGARAVVFDIVFSGAGPDPEADRAFATAIQRNGRVWLAAERNQWDRETVTSAVAAQSVVLPYAPFLEAAAGWGVAVLRPEDDFMVRRAWLGPAADGAPALTWAVAEGLGARTNRPDWLRYQGGPLALPHVGFSAALQPDEVPDAFFRDRVVVVGARPMVGGFVERRDEFRNPLGRFAFGRVFMPAVEVHATQLVNLLRGDGLHRPGPASEAAAVVGIGLLLAWGFSRMRPMAVLAAWFAAEAALLGGVAVGMREGVWFPWLIVAAVQLPGGAVAAIAHHSVQSWRQRRRLEAEKRAAVERIREQAALIDAASDAIVVQDLDGAVRFVNPTAARWYGDSPAAALRLGGVESSAREKVQKDGTWMGEATQESADGRELRVQSRWTLLKDEEGRPQSILAINTDLTDQRRLEAQFLRMQRMETVGALAGGMAHDLNNALAPVLLGVQLLRRGEADEERRRLLDLMEANANRGSDLVRQVLLFARGRGGTREILRPDSVVRELAAVLRPALPREIRVEAMVAEDVWPVLVDPTQLNQVLLNLAINARDAMAATDGGELVLAVDNVVLDETEAAELRGGRAGEFVLFLVSDTGPGIPPDVMARLFEPFFTTKPSGSGTGLGLASVARIVRAHDGFVHVRSTVGEGAAFEVYLPRSLWAVAASEGVAAPTPEASVALVVTRELSLGGMVAEALRETGARVVMASRPEEVSAMMDLHRGRMRWMIVDTGVTEVAVIHPEPGVRVVVLGGDATGLPAGFVRLARPFTREQLVQAVRGEPPWSGSGPQSA